LPAPGYGRIVFAMHLVMRSLVALSLLTTMIAAPAQPAPPVY